MHSSFLVSSPQFTALPLPDYYFDSEEKVKAEYQRLVVLILDALQKEGQVSKLLCDLLPMAFELRIRAMIANPAPIQAHLEAIEAFYGEIGRVKDGIGFEQLMDSVKFAMRLVYRSIDQMAETQSLGPASDKNSIAVLASVSYDVFQVICGLIPKGETLYAWLNSTLLVEFGVMALDAFAHGKRLPAEGPLQEMAAVVTEAAQTYSACARALGIVAKRGSGIQMQWPEDVSADMLAEQRSLAETGIDECNSLLSDN